MSGITFALSTPITAHGKEVETLELAKPGTKDVRELGYPFSATPGANGEADMKLFPEIGARWISRLAKIPMSSVDQMDPSDFLVLHTELCGFFAPAEPTASSKSVSSTAPGSGT